MADAALIKIYYLAEVITLIDAVNGDTTLDAQPEALKQAAVADTLLISKSELASPEAMAALHTRLRHINPAAGITLVADQSDNLAGLLGGASFNPQLKGEQVLTWLKEEAFADHSHHHHDDHNHAHHHDHTHDINRHDDRISAICLTLDEALPAEVFDEWFGLLTLVNGVNLLRVKGLINITGIGQPLVIHGVQHIWHPPVMLAQWPCNDRRSRIVFILRDVGESELRTALGFVMNKYEGARLLGSADLLSGFTQALAR